MSLRGAFATKQSKNKEKQQDCFVTLTMTGNTKNILFTKDEFIMVLNKQEER